MSTIYTPQSHTIGSTVPVTIREASFQDRDALRRLAERDSAPVPSGRLLLGEVDGELRAAVAVGGGDAIADPFHHTAELVDLLRARAEQIDSRRSLRVIARSPALAGRALHRQAA
jgi:hypothetical protein